MKIFDCDSVLEQISDFIDADAREEICQQIQAHLSVCKDCSVFVDKVKKTIVLYQGNKTDAVIPLRTTAALAKAMQDAYAGGSTD